MGELRHKPIYLDHAATTSLSPYALGKIAPYFYTDYGNPSSVHCMGQSAKKAVTEARKTIAKCINANPWEIMFTASGTESDNQAIRSALDVYWDRWHIITSPFEHPAVFETVRNCVAESGYKEILLPVDRKGVVSVSDLESAVTEDTALVSVMAVNNEIGTVQPIPEIGEICKERKISFHVDAVQAAGHIPIDVRKWGVDYLSMSAHKFHGPKGVGILYVRDGCPVHTLIHGGGQEYGFRSGTENVAGIVGAAAALKEACDKMQENRRVMEELREVFRKKMEGFPGIKYNGSIFSVPNIINLRIDGVNGENLVSLLDKRDIYISTGSACSSGDLKPSRTLTAIGLSEEEALSSVRISLDSSNTRWDMSVLASELKECVTLLRDSKI